MTRAVLKNRFTKEGAEQLLTNCKQLKMTAEDGKKRLTDVTNTKQLLRLVQSIPSPKAEPFKMWLAQVGAERLDEIAAPEISISKIVLVIKAAICYNQLEQSSIIIITISDIRMHLRLLRDFQNKKVEVSL